MKRKWGVWSKNSIRGCGSNSWQLVAFVCHSDVQAFSGETLTVVNDCTGKSNKRSSEQHTLIP